MITEIKATIQILINVIVIFCGIYLLGRFWWFCILLVFDDISVDAGATKPIYIKPKHFHVYGSCVSNSVEKAVK